MNKHLLLLLIATIGLLSCGDDDKPFVPELNKLTKIICTKNAGVTPVFTADITYSQGAQINRIVTDRYTDNYIYVGNTISVNGIKTDGTSPSTSFIHTVYTLNGSTITLKEDKAESEQQNNEVYTSVASTYVYNRSLLNSISQMVQWPNVNGTGYQTRSLGEIDRFTWENGNVVHYAHLPQQEMTYEYTSNLRPTNFPFRVISTLRPIDLETISPVNLLFGTLNRLLPDRAYWYNVTEATSICAEYVFDYTFTSDYITGMTIKEKINLVNGATQEENTYEYTFVYNYAAK